MTRNKELNDFFPEDGSSNKSDNFRVKIIVPEIA